MDKIKTTGIVVRSVEYGEADKILTLITLEFGKITVLARGVKKDKAKLKYAAAPFSFGEYVLASSQGDRLTLAECVQQESFFELTTELDRYYAGFILLETLEKLSVRESNPDLFIAVLTGLKDLAYGESDAKISLVQALLSVLEVSGYGLNFRTCANCGGALGKGVTFDFSSGLVCSSCVVADGVGVPDAVLAFLHSLSNKTDLKTVEIDDTALRATVELVLLLLGRLCAVKLYSAKDFLSVC